MARLQKLDIPKAIDQRLRASLSKDEVEAILEISYLAIASDGRLSPGEVDAFADAVISMADPDQILTLMDRAAGTALQKQDNACYDVDDVRLKTITGKLRNQAAREQAYKLAYAMATSDVRTGDCEFRYDQHLRRALGLSDDAAERLIDQVIETLSVI